LQQTELAFIFPAFTTEHPFTLFPGDRGLSDHFGILLQQAIRHANLPVSKDFHLSGDAIIKEELSSQVITYIYSCTLSDYFHQKGAEPAYSAGYSMGLYAALYHSRAIAFTGGIDVILSAYHEIRRVTGEFAYGMVSVIGLEENDIASLIRSKNLSLEITNRNNPVAFIVTGKLEEVAEFTRLAKEEGAIHLHIMNVSVPYHSRELKKVENPFRDFVNSLKIGKPEIPVISLIDQVALDSKDKIREELVRNLYIHLDWRKTQEYLEKSGVSVFVEMGPDNNLVKNARFIKGNFRFLTASEYFLSFQK
jgi:[acyl-carrier-protein] S-malonyltransferase